MIAVAVQDTPRPPVPFELADDAEWVVAVADGGPEDPGPRFEVVAPADARPCRNGSPAKGFCKRPSVARLNRSHASWRGGTVPREAWWHYCERHLFGRWIEDGQVRRWQIQLKAAP